MKSLKWTALEFELTRNRSLSERPSIFEPNEVHFIPTDLQGPSNSFKDRSLYLETTHFQNRYLIFDPKVTQIKNPKLRLETYDNKMTIH